MRLLTAGSLVRAQHGEPNRANAYFSNYIDDLKDTEKLGQILRGGPVVRSRAS